MFSLSESNKFYLYYSPTDMRKSFDGLCGLVSNKMSVDPCSGDVYIFINKSRNKIKLLHWESGGFVLYYKRLEEGTIEFPILTNEVASLHLDWTDLMLMISGISLSKVTRRKRYK
jgi:transposase